MRKLITLCVFLWSGTALGIVIIDQDNMLTPVNGFSAAINGAFKSSAGNSEKIDMDLGAKLLWRQGNNSSLILSNYSFGESAGKNNADEFFLHGRYITHQDEKYAREVFLQFEFDKFARLESRMLLGAGLRRDFIKPTPEKMLRLGSGLFYVQERLEKISGAIDDTKGSFWRLNGYLNYKQALNKTVNFLTTVYLQPTLTNFSDYRLLAETAFKFVLTKDITLKLAVDIKHDSQPPQLVEKTDIRTQSVFEYRIK